MKINFRSFIFICCICLLSFSAASFPSGGALAAVDSKPLFEVPVGTADSAETGTLGEWVVEEDVRDYDKFYYPAAFCADEKNGLILVLDSARNRICAFSKDGKPAGEINIPYDLKPVDFAWLPKLETFFVVFSDKAQIAVINVDVKNGLKIKAHALAEPGGLAGAATGIQNIWPYATSTGKDNIFAISFNSGYDAPAAAFLYNGDRFIKLCDVYREMTGIAASHEKPYVYNVYFNDTLETGLQAMDLRSGKTSKNVLPGEFLPREGEGCCASCRPLGADEAGNVYLEAHFSNGEISESAYVYKFDRNMKQTAKTEIFRSPEMLSNRFVYLDASGAVYYMRLDVQNRKIQFYRFEI